MPITNFDPTIRFLPCVVCSRPVDVTCDTDQGGDYNDDPQHPAHRGCWNAQRHDEPTKIGDVKPNVVWCQAIYDEAKREASGKGPAIPAARKQAYVDMLVDAVENPDITAWNWQRRQAACARLILMLATNDFAGKFAPTRGMASRTGQNKGGVGPNFGPPTQRRPKSRDVGDRPDGHYALTQQSSGGNEGQD